ncbi:4-hydroxy-tetrahydrodipicolinate synthase [Streptococcus macacae]|uniref:4-hydroxy-tetrahydrodipicolinate synthase n=1 Tax=Streptococcus macacae NCTC 11558 TaxID=764298 RepID=G5JU77_9STRE|nr:4-hydroxy-tetrahydrodipicolinate synthase [Streptococcus macacae]EHJ52656.1 dihydrodipicolinate synthase [Streptococcus macacae NCTC 11558]SUN78442.1 dihydrodipicolinate synthase [Streptococcus macacae NCTC 11558]
MAIEDFKDVKIITAFVTPFNEDGSINFEALPKLIEHLLAHHTEGLLLAGTTAESPTLTHDEELELFAAVHKIVNGRVPLIAGIGTNDTRDSVAFAKEVAEFGGFSAGLAIVPYYNKPSQEGLYQHFKAIADASSLPIIIYNIPGRVVVKLETETLLRLASHPNIIGVKDCTSLDEMTLLIEHKPEDFLVYSGEDGEAFHAMNLGADGLISVASHTNGDEIYEMFQAIEKGEMQKAAKIQRQFLPKVQALFSVASPAPVKAVLNHQGFETGPLRLPLVSCTDEEAREIIAIVEN